jgi:hypothetical protein
MRSQQDDETPLHPRRPTSRNEVIGLAAGLAAFVVLTVMKISGTTEEDVPLRLLSAFVLLLGLGGLWFAVRLTPEGHQRERKSWGLLQRLLASLPYGPYRWVMGALSLGIAGLGIWGLIFGAE